MSTPEPIITGERGVDRDYTCVRCGQTARDRWDAQGRHVGGRTEPCAQHPSAPGRGPCLFVESSTGRVLGNYHGADALREVAAWVTRTLALAALLALYAGALLYAPPVSSQVERRLSPREAALGITLARVSFNEALDSEADLSLVWQVVRGRAQSPAGRLAFLRRHSSCASGVLPSRLAALRPGNCRWSRTLHVRGHQPEGWDVARDGEWRRLRGRWLAHLARALDHVRLGDDAPVVCEGTPWTWDGRRWAARWRERGLVEIRCAGTANAGLMRRRDAARGDGPRSAASAAVGDDGDESKGGARCRD